MKLIRFFSFFQESFEESASDKMSEDDECSPGPSSQNSIASEDSGIGSYQDVNMIEQLSTVKMQHGKPVDDARMCKICYNRELRKVFVPCGHLVACAECAKNMKTCAVCRKPVIDTVQAFIS